MSNWIFVLSKHENRDSHKPLDYSKFFSTQLMLNRSGAISIAPERFIFFLYYFG
jgi:hypothetical protein